MTETHSQMDEHVIANSLFEEGKYGEAFERYRTLADGGSLTAQLRVGWMYHVGCGVPQDLDAASRWYQKAADENSLQGQFYLGTLYRERKQYQQAIAWLEKSASQGYLPALYRLGRMYDVGEGVTVDRDKSYRYFRLAADAGHLFSQREVAVKMIKGHQGIRQIPRGFYILARLFPLAVGLASKDPESDRIRR